MLYVQMGTAAFAVAIVTALCYGLKIQRWYVISLMQFALGTAVTYGIAAYVARSGYEESIFWTSAGLCAFLALLFAGMRYLFGPLRGPGPGAADRKYQQKTQEV